MLLHILQGNETGHVKEFERYGGEHAVQTGFARLATEDEADQHRISQGALTAANEAVPEETPEEPKQAGKGKGKGKKE